MRILLGHKKTNNSRANISEKSHEEETIKSTKNCPYAARVVFTYLDTHLFTVLLYLDAAVERRILGSCVFCAPLDRHIGRHIDRQSTDVSADISVECRPICRSTYRSSVGRYVDRDVSLDISADISIKHRSICRLTLDRYVGRYVDREWLSDCQPTCRSIGCRQSADTSLLLSYW